MRAKQGIAIDYAAARQLLEDAFSEIEKAMLQATPPPNVPSDVAAACETVFASATQAYREVLLGCALARNLDKGIDIRRPYAKLGPKAFNGRTLDEKVINPFLNEKRVPCSKAPYLNTFRRSVMFVEETSKGVRDRVGYQAFLRCIEYLENTTDDDSLRTFLKLLLFLFHRLREAADIALTRVQRISLEQYEQLLARLLETASGGRLPLLFAAAMLLTIKEHFGLKWDVKWQGINVADASSGAGGDITVSENGRILMAAEVTERTVDKSRVVSTFLTKIAPQGIDDYLFFARPSEDSSAKRQAHQYFAQGHEVNFLEIRTWLSACLATVGKRGREEYNRILVDLLSARDVPAPLKVAWNQHIAAVIGGSVV